MLAPCRCLIVLDNVWDRRAIDAFRFNDSWATILVTAREASVLPRHERATHWKLLPDINHQHKDGKAAPDLQLLRSIVKGSRGCFKIHEEVQCLTCHHNYGLSRPGSAL